MCEQMTSSDKDFRFMATNDLMSELQKDSIKLDDDSERKVSHICIIDGLKFKCLLQKAYVEKVLVHYIMTSLFRTVY